ncbi:MAG: toll/interleukin-1 receptor domain-containing protein [Longimicrobiaceae bacterium]
MARHKLRQVYTDLVEAIFIRVLEEQTSKKKVKMAWDYFISHASEDKDLVARPLAHVLCASDFQVWYDEFSLRVGDSLFQSISRGLAESSFGVVVLSPAFMQKSWTQNELAGIWARETATRKLLLPVWHRVGAAQVAERMPMLADRVAVSTDKGLQHVAEEIVRASYPDRISDLPLSLQEAEKTAHARDTLRGLIDGGASVNDLRLFLSAHQELLPRRGILIPAFKLGADALADFVFIGEHGITGPMQMDLVSLGPCFVDQGDIGEAATSLTTSIVTQLGKKRKQKQRGFNDYLGPPYVGEFAPLLRIASIAVQTLTGKQPLSPDSSLDDIREEMERGWNIHMRRPDLWSARFLIVIGRRTPNALPHKNKIAVAFDNFVDIASYDRLLDTPRDL